MCRKWAPLSASAEVRCCLTVASGVSDDKLSAGLCVCVCVCELCDCHRSKEDRLYISLAAGVRLAPLPDAVSLRKISFLFQLFAVFPLLQMSAPALALKLQNLQNHGDFARESGSV